LGCEGSAVQICPSRPFFPFLAFRNHIERLSVCGSIRPLQLQSSPTKLRELVFVIDAHAIGWAAAWASAYCNQSRTSACTAGFRRIVAGLSHGDWASASAPPVAPLRPLSTRPVIAIRKLLNLRYRNRVIRCADKHLFGARAAGVVAKPRSSLGQSYGEN